MLFLLFGPLSSASDHYIPFATSPPFPVDTRRVAPQSEGTSGVFIADTRALDGVIGFAVSGDAGIHTGGYSMGVPLVTGILPQVVPGIDGRQWITLTGFNFLSGARVVLRTGNETFTIPPERTQVLSDTSIRVFVNVTSAPAEWTAQVTNPGGLPSPPLAFAVGGAAVSPASAVDFGTLPLNTHAERTFTLRNTGDSEIAWSSAAGGFFSILGPVSGTLAPGASIALTLRYTPTAPGPHALTARFNIGRQIHQRELSGRGTAGEIAGNATLSGRVVAVDSSGETIPVASAKVTITPGNAQTAGTPRTAYTNSNGEFRFETLTVGLHQITARPGISRSPTYQATSIGSMIESGQNTLIVELQPRPVTPPYTREIEAVVLVRGLGKEGEDEELYWASMHDYLSKVEKFEVWDPNKNGNLVLSGEQNYNFNAFTLENFIIAEVIRIKNGENVHVKAIHLIAHSMGGLTCRRLISNQIHKNATDPKLPEIKTLITLSTPHAGSPLGTAGSVVAWYTGDWDWKPNWQSTKSCSTQAVLNQIFDWPSDPKESIIRIAVAGGNIQAGIDKDKEKDYKFANKWLFEGSLPRAEAINDGAVSLPSSLGHFHRSSGYQKWEKVYTFPQVKSGSGWLVAEPSQANFNHSDIKSDISISKWVAGILRNRLPSTTSSRSPRNDPPPDEPEPFSGLAVDQRSFPLTPGATELATLPLTGIGKAQWLVSLTDRQVAVRLQRPLGAGWISGAGPGVTWEVVDEEDGDGRWIEITLDDPEAGLWGIEFDGAGLVAAAEVAVSVMEEGGPTFEAASGGLAAAGAAVPMLAAASWDNGLTSVQVSGGTVEATVIEPDGTESLRVLPDDGLNGDGAAGDGIHGLLAEEFSDPGIYDVLLRYQGSHPDTGAAFRRLARGSFTRSADGGFIAGIEGHRTVDADGDGYPEAVILDVRVDNLDPGNFTLAGTLAEADGDGSFQGVTEFHRAEAGAGIVNLVFDKHNLPMGRESGPFEIRELRLIRAEGAREWLHDHPPGYAVETTMFNSYSRFLRVSGEFDFGWVKAGESATRILRIHNDGWGPMIVGNPELPAGFTGSFEGEIPAGGFQDVEITFSPTAAASYGGAFDIPSNANAGTVEAVWSGTGYDGILLADWLVEKGVPEADRGPLADPNGDGIPNLLAYLFNIAPIGGDAGDRATALPTPRLGEDGEGRYLALRYRHHKDAERLTVTLEACEDFEAESWQAITPDAIIDLAPDPATGDPIREFRVRIGDEPKRFVRMVVREQG